MPKMLNCSDTGTKCNAVITGDSEKEVFDKAREHARSVHNLALRNDAKTRQKLSSAIKES